MNRAPEVYPPHFTKIELVAGIAGATASAAVFAGATLGYDILRDMRIASNQQLADVYGQAAQGQQATASTALEAHQPLVTGAEIGGIASAGLVGFLAFTAACKVVQGLRHRTAHTYAAREAGIGPHVPESPPTEPS